MDNHEQSGNASGDSDGAQGAAKGATGIDAADAKPKLGTRDFNRRRVLLLMSFYGLGLATGFGAWGGSGTRNSRSDVQSNQDESDDSHAAAVASAPPALPAAYTLPVAFHDIGPRILASGAIDYERFLALYAGRGRPLSEAQMRVLQTTTDEPIVFDWDNENFLLNFFWAVGLANANPILTDGPMTQYAGGEVGGFASTGGWTLGTLAATELFAGTSLVSLTPVQQARVEEVAAAVYRPCCNNPTSFPDCNHGMAMLGLLQVMAGQGVGVEEMFAAAKHVNLFWFPQQTSELALFFRQGLEQEFDEVDARLAVSMELASAGGAAAVGEWLREAGGADGTPAGGTRCGV